ncbi:histidine kinase [Streptomyces sp. Q6]|uniref:Histidine kinase n=1 Tax=Streptomyces citrinus TaxID=3118173 RepID=A0ACD5AES9_9ACTN
MNVRPSLAAALSGKPLRAVPLRRRTVLADLALWAALTVPVLAVEGLHLHEPDSTWQQLAGIAALGVATALHRRRPAVAFLIAAAPGLAVASSLFTLSYGCALAAFAYLMGLRPPTARPRPSTPSPEAAPLEAASLAGAQLEGAQPAGAQLEGAPLRTTRLEAEPREAEPREAAPFTPASTLRPSLLAFAALAATGTVKIAIRQVDPAAEWLVLMGTLLFGAVFPWLIGRYWRQSRELTAAGWARAEQLEREHRIVADRARLRERARIAQDMHDSLGHELSLIALRAGALQVTPGLADPHRTAAAELRAAASDATDRLHSIIGLLREEDDEPAPLTPPGETVAELVERAAESGLPVRLLSAPAADDRTLYRVVQEALTNAAKHAPGAPVTVATEQDGGAVTVTVTNGRPPRAPAAPPGSGTGLLGLRARITALGGTFDAGPHGDGFRVTAHLPAPGTPRPGAAAFAHARRTARRHVSLAFGAAAVAGTVLIGGSFTWYAYTKTHAVLTPQAYAQLRIGTPLADVESRLPARTISDPPVERAPTPPPAHADCRYYRASGELFVPVEHFRLCFATEGSHALIGRAVIPKAGTADQVQEEEREWAR